MSICNIDSFLSFNNFDNISFNNFDIFYKFDNFNKSFLLI